MHIHPLLTTTADLQALCDRLAASDFVAVDTEFMRENSYYPELCLIQIGNDQEAAAVDPKSPDLDLGPLLTLLVDNHDVLKVFHAGGQDIEIIFNLTGKTPQPLFDSQIAAMALSQNEQIGYSNLVQDWLGIALDKGARFTDWSRRPLNQRQIDYAIGDVTHLATLFPMMLEKLRGSGRGRWIDEEMERLANPANYAADPDMAWHRVKFPGRNAEALGRLKALAAWREREAQHKNLPRGRIMRDETLADLAAHPPSSQEKLGQVRGLSNSWKSNDIGARLMQILQNAKPLPNAELPDRDNRRSRPTKDNGLVADLLKLMLKIRSAQINVASRLLARSEDVDRLVCGDHQDLPLLQGWRYEQFGRDALDLIEGRVSFSVEKGYLRMRRIKELAAPEDSD